jgi:hypothetical protein
MASTGLLTNVNPYRSGNVAVDFSSKPLQYAVQEIQHQKAKAEATDKYFMDWEKSINPAGLAQGELNKFAEKLRAAKEYAIKNKEQINNPSKYGYDAQSTLTAMFKDAQGYVELGKQATANRKAFKSYLDSVRKSGKHISGDFEVLGNAMKTVGDGYVEPDTSMVEIYDPHNPMDYANKVYSKIPLSESAPVPYDVKEMPGYYYTKTTSTVNPKYKDALLQEGYTNYVNDVGLRKQMDYVFDRNKEEVARLEQKYNTKIPNAQALAGVYTWDLQPVKETTTDARELASVRRTAEEEKAKRTIDYNKGQGAPIRNLFDDIASLKPITNLSKDFTLSRGLVTGKEGKPYNGDITNISGENIPPDVFTVLENYKINVNPRDKFKLIVKDGRIQGFQTKKGQIIDRNTIEAAQRKYDTERKGEGLYMNGNQAKQYKGLDINGNPIYE